MDSGPSVDSSSLWNFRDRASGLTFLTKGQKALGGDVARTVLAENLPSLSGEAGEGGAGQNLARPFCCSPEARPP